MSEQQQAKFEGWAKVEVMGHQTHIGFVTTEAYGAAVLFRVDQPPFEEREFVLTKPTYKSVKTAENLDRSQWWPAGTKMKREALPPASVLVGSQSIYRITPCTEAAARLAIEIEQPRPLILVELPPENALPAPTDRTFPCCGRTPEEGHEPGCVEHFGEEEDDLQEQHDLEEEEV